MFKLDYLSPNKRGSKVEDLTSLSELVKQRIASLISGFNSVNNSPSGDALSSPLHATVFDLGEKKEFRYKVILEGGVLILSKKFLF